MLRGLKYYCLCVRRTFQHGPGNTLCIHWRHMRHMSHRKKLKMHMSKEQLLFTLQMFMLFV